MKKRFGILLLSLIPFFYLNAQSFKVSFTGSGLSTTIDSVIVENLSQCTEATIYGNDTLHLVGATSIDEKLISNLSLYPNPTLESSYLSFYNNVEGYVFIELFDLSGRKVAFYKQFISVGVQRFSISNLSIGTYIVKIKSSVYNYEQKLVSLNTVKDKNISINHIGTSEMSKKSVANKIKTSVIMSYNTGERLKLTAFSGNYKRVKTFIATQDEVIDFNFVSCTDYHGYHYAVVTIGTQTWMAENLKTTTYKNGNSISFPDANNADWENNTNGAYAWYDNLTSNKDVFGGLYNWYAVGTGNLCPTGWHVPTDAEFTTLINYVGGESIAGGKLKDVCNSYWNAPNTSAVDEFGFSARATGSRFPDGTYNFVGTNAYFWTSDLSNPTQAWYRYMFHNYPQVDKNDFNRNIGFSVRCIMD